MHKRQQQQSGFFAYDKQKYESPYKALKDKSEFYKFYNVCSLMEVLIKLIFIEQHWVRNCPDTMVYYQVSSPRGHGTEGLSDHINMFESHDSLSELKAHSEKQGKKIRCKLSHLG